MSGAVEGVALLEALIPKLRRMVDSGHRTLGGGTVSHDGQSSIWGNEPIMKLANPDGPEIAAAIGIFIASLTTPPARSYADGVGKVEQPLCNTVPDRIYLLDCGSGDISWCGDPDPDGANDDAVAVEYVRVGVWRKPVEPDDAA
jgi:hypothetical protein